MATMTKGRKVTNGTRTNGKTWWTPAVLLGVIGAVGTVGMMMINGADAASKERTEMVRKGLYREIDVHRARSAEQFKAMDNRLERIENKIDKLMEK